jgi:hypothetical protein
MDCHGGFDNAESQDLRAAGELFIQRRDPNNHGSPEPGGRRRMSFLKLLVGSFVGSVRSFTLMAAVKVDLHREPRGALRNRPATTPRGGRHAPPGVVGPNRVIPASSAGAVAAVVLTWVGVPAHTGTRADPTRERVVPEARPPRTVHRDWSGQPLPVVEAVHMQQTKGAALLK